MLFASHGTLTESRPKKKFTNPVKIPMLGFSGLKYGYLALIVAVTAALTTVRAQSKPATPLEPISAIIDAFRTHDIVALGEGQHNEQGYAFRLALIRDPNAASGSGEPGRAFEAVLSVRDGTIEITLVSRSSSNADRRRGAPRDRLGWPSHSDRAIDIRSQYIV